MFGKKERHLEFSFLDNGFLWEDREYRFANVLSIRFARARHDVHTIGMGVTSSVHQASLIIDMNNGEEVKIKEGVKFLRSTSEKIVDHISDIYIAISHKTFDQRIQRYIQEINMDTYFDYNGWRFHPAARYIELISSNERYYVDKCSFLKSYGFIQIKQHLSLIKKILEWPPREIGINTTTDTDVIFPLLRMYFGLSWGD